MKGYFPILLLAATASNAQTPPATTPPATATPAPAGPPPSLETLLAPLSARQLGPATMGGRIADIAVYEKDPRTFFVASASGGLWRTDNAGTTFTPIFEQQPSASMGCVSVQQDNPNIIWVGTGECASRNSVAWGDGIYKTTDCGKTWANLGLKETQHIARILIDPSNPDHVTVAALGHLWDYNKERGIYQTTDGGKTWKRTLFIDDKTGIIDLVQDPSNSKTMLCAAWQRLRQPWTFLNGGPGSGIYKSTDGGATWKKITAGLPTGPMGRIGLTVSRQDPKLWIATVEAQGGGVFRSKDGGDTWEQMSKFNPRPFYFSRPLIDPIDSNRVYFAGVNFHYSDDQGKTVRTMNPSVHVDYHAIWVDPTNNNTILVGEDGGVGRSRDRGAKWEFVNNLPIGQYYQAAFDLRRPYWIYGGLQDNGSWGIPTQSKYGGVTFWHSMNISGGDGFYCQVDATAPNIVYSESQGGALYRTDLKTGDSKFVQPKIKGEKLRFNWNTPYITSKFKPQTLFFGANRLMKSEDRGETWNPISPDLTTDNKDKQKPGLGSVFPENTGAESHCTIVALSESPLKEGVLWAGTDDGNLQLTLDGGKTWTNVVGNVKGLPKNTWCSRVVASKFAEGKAYALFDGHRTNDFKPYGYVTADFGKTWNPITNGIPDGDSLYALSEGDKNPDLIFLGSEFGLYISIDGGDHWTRYKGNFPTVAVHDLKFHPVEHDLIMATHGRSIWTLDGTALDQLDKTTRTSDVVLLSPRDILNVPVIGDRFGVGDRDFFIPNTQPRGIFYFYAIKDGLGEATIVVNDKAGKREFYREKTTAKAGLNVFSMGTHLDPGDYNVKLTLAGKDYTTNVHVVGALELNGLE
ncbi:MAG: hypothetical protein JSS72_00385 [Armatimonadetes bacterium]|nr:hypothetical protein [Armatimonadota bacterium]